MSKLCGPLLPLVLLSLKYGEAFQTISSTNCLRRELPTGLPYQSLFPRSQTVSHAFLNLSGRRDKIKIKKEKDDSGIQRKSEKEPEKTEVPVAATTRGKGPLKAEGPGSKLRMLKDLMWVREALEDLTAAEFACTVEAAAENEKPSRRRKRAVDYEKLLGQLNLRLRDMGCNDMEENASCELDSETGAGVLTYPAAERQALLEHLIMTRQLLLEVIKGYELDLDSEAFSLKLPELPELRVEIPRQDEPSSPGPKLYVRDDGTVDWDGALQDRAAIKNFGTAVWARINGREPETVDANSEGNDRNTKPIVTVKIEETEAIVESRKKLKSLTSELTDLESEYIDLINSVISKGQAVANVNLAMLEPAQRTKVRETTEAIAVMKEKVTFQTLVYELERVYTYLSGELGNPSTKGYIPLQDRLNVAEFGLLESQIDTFHTQINQGTPIDADVIAVVLEQMTDFKRRLGIDYLVTGITFDGDAIKRYTLELVEKSRNGLAFYAKGCKLFWNDIVFCLSLVNRAAQGYTLKPREVRTIRYVQYFISSLQKS